MHHKLLQAAIIIAATAVLPVGLLAYNTVQVGEPEGYRAMPLLLIAHCLVVLAAIPAFRKTPALSWVLLTLLYPFGVAIVLSMLTSPMGNPLGILWFLGIMIVMYWWVIIPVSGITATIVFILTRSNRHPDTTTPDRGPAAPTT